LSDHHEKAVHYRLVESARLYNGYPRFEKRYSELNLQAWAYNLIPV